LAKNGARAASPANEHKYTRPFLLPLRLRGGCSFIPPLFSLFNHSAAAEGDASDDDEQSQRRDRYGGDDPAGDSPGDTLTLSFPRAFIRSALPVAVAAVARLQASNARARRRLAELQRFTILVSVTFRRTSHKCHQEEQDDDDFHLVRLCAVAPKH